MTANSGSDVPKAITLRPTIDSDIPNESAMPVEPSISSSAPQTIITPPNTVTIEDNSIFSPIQVSSNSSSRPSFFELL